MKINRYELNIKTNTTIDEKTLKGNIDSTATFAEVDNKGHFPDYISVEVFDALVLKLKEQLVMEGKLIPKAENPCPGCQQGYGHIGCDSNGNYFCKTCSQDCVKLKRYYELLAKRGELNE